MLSAEADMWENEMTILKLLMRKYKRDSQVEEIYPAYLMQYAENAILWLNMKMAEEISMKWQWLWKLIEEIYEEILMTIN